MIMLTVTKPRRKLKRLLKIGALALLLGVVVPGIYHSLETVGAMSLFASGEQVQEEEYVAKEVPESELTAEEAEAEAEPAADAAEAEAAEDAAEAAEAGEAETEEQVASPGLLSALRNVIFGEKPEVLPY